MHEARLRTIGLKFKSGAGTVKGALNRVNASEKEFYLGSGFSLALTDAEARNDDDGLARRPWT